MMATRYFPATVRRVVDGDTLEVMVDHGWSIYTVQHVRLAGLNAPELNAVGGVEARAAVVEWCKVYGRPEVLLATDKPDPRDKYGRYVAAVTSITNPDRDLGRDLIDAGHAVKWSGRGARP